MNDQAQLYAQRITELEQLLSGHLEAHSLDEGNASAFDELIGAWLEEELIRIDLSHADRLRHEVAAVRRAAVADVQARQSAHRTELEARGRRTRQALHEEERQRRRQRLEEARRARSGKRLAMAEERLAVATAQLRRAEHLLLGDQSRPDDTAPQLTTTSPSRDDHRRTEERIA